MRRPSRGRFTCRSLALKLVLLIILAAAGGSAAATRSAREEEDLVEGDDTACLKGFLDTVKQESSTSIVTTWTAAAIVRPCNHTGILIGITCNNSRVVSISLPAANLAGTLPSSLSFCYFLQTLDLSANSLSGSLPASLGALSLLSTLSLGRNKLSGAIPYELATCSSLSSLDLHENEVTGLIPAQLGLLPLQYFDVSNNNLSGRIPSTLSNTSSGSPRFSASFFANNANLYGFPLNPKPPSAPSSYPSSNIVRTHSIFVILAIALATGLASFTIVYFLVSLWLDIRAKHLELGDIAEKEHNTPQRHNSSLGQQSMGWRQILHRLC